jgi:hypothetical protein
LDANWKKITTFSPVAAFIMLSGRLIKILYGQRIGIIIAKLSRMGNFWR